VTFDISVAPSDQFAQGDPVRLEHRRQGQLVDDEQFVGCLVVG
jgi:hypothetical protein